jgi:hypothetical protein
MFHNGNFDPTKPDIFLRSSATTSFFGRNIPLALLYSREGEENDS